MMRIYKCISGLANDQPCKQTTTVKTKRHTHVDKKTNIHGCTTQCRIRAARQRFEDVCRFLHRKYDGYGHGNDQR